MAEEITESTFRVSFTNRLNLQRIVLPEARISGSVPGHFLRPPRRGWRR